MAHSLRSGLTNLEYFIKDVKPRPRWYTCSDPQSYQTSFMQLWSNPLSPEPFESCKQFWQQLNRSFRLCWALTWVWAETRHKANSNVDPLKITCLHDVLDMSINVLWLMCLHCWLREMLVLELTGFAFISFIDKASGKLESSAKIIQTSWQLLWFIPLLSPP